MKPLRLMQAILACTLILALPALAERKRPVHPGAAVIPNSLSGTVVDAVTGLPLANATVKLGLRNSVTDAQGHFAFPTILAGPGIVTTSHASYNSDIRSVAFAPGVNSLRVTLRKGEATLTLTTGQTKKIAVNRTEIGYVRTFAGFEKGPYPGVDVCRGASAEVARIPMSDIKAIIGPAVVAGQNNCCGRADGQALRIRLHSGEEFDAILEDACMGYRLDLSTYDIAATDSLAVPLASVARIEFP